MQEKKAAPEENGNAAHAVEAAAASTAIAKEEEAEAWRSADPYAFFPSPAENNKVPAPVAIPPRSLTSPVRGRAGALDRPEHAPRCAHMAHMQGRAPAH